MCVMIQLDIGPAMTPDTGTPIANIETMRARQLLGKGLSRGMLKREERRCSP